MVRRKKLNPSSQSTYHADLRDQLSRALQEVVAAEANGVPLSSLSELHKKVELLQDELRIAVEREKIAAEMGSASVDGQTIEEGSSQFHDVEEGEEMPKLKGGAAISEGGGAAISEGGGGGGGGSIEKDFSAILETAAGSAVLQLPLQSQLSGENSKPTKKQVGLSAARTDLIVGIVLRGHYPSHRKRS